MRFLLAAVALTLIGLPAVAVKAADCVQIQPSGRVEFTGEAADTCSTHQLLTADDYNTILASVPLWTATPEEIQQAFIAGFSLPLICYLVAWAYQLVINFATKDEGEI